MDELFSQRPDGFADAYLFSAFLRPRGTQVHKINAGQQQHKNTDSAKQPYILDRSRPKQSRF